MFAACFCSSFPHYDILVVTKLHVLSSPGAISATANHCRPCVAAGRPTGFSDAPAGYTPAPTGFSDGPPGGAAYQAPVAQAGQFGELTRKVQIPNAKVGNTEQSFHS